MASRTVSIFTIITNISVLSYKVSNYHPFFFIPSLIIHSFLLLIPSLVYHSFLHFLIPTVLFLPSLNFFSRISFLPSFFNSNSYKVSKYHSFSVIPFLISHSFLLSIPHSFSRLLFLPSFIFNRYR